MNTDGVFERAVPKPPQMKELHCQILVLGGGLPGVCAAIQAAQEGADVVLVEQRKTLGGNCGPAIGVHPSDAHRFHPYMVSTGTVGRLIEDAAYVHAKTDSNDFHYNISMRWDTVMNEALEEAGVRALLSHYAHTPYLADNKIVAVLCEDTLTCNRVLIHVSDCVIDDTGDGNISERAGAVYRMGREAKEEFGEFLAPEKAESTTMGNSLVTLIRDTRRKSPFIPEKDIPPFVSGYGGDCRFYAPPDASLLFWFPTETGGNQNTISDGHAIYRRLRKQLDSAWNEMKNVKNDGSADNWEMVWCSAEMGKRESRRFEGDYILTQNDLQAGTLFDDAVAVGGFAMDIHYPKPDAPDYVCVKYHLIPPLYTIPYRCVYSRNVSNLFFASRLLSVTHLAHGSVRLQRTLAGIGQAVGMAAAMCCEQGMTPRELYTGGYIPQLQQRLIKEDATIMGVRNADIEDKARSARVSSSSELKYEVDGDPRFEKLGDLGGAELWSFSDCIDRCEVLMRNPTERDITVRFALRRFAPEHPWQFHGEREFFDYYKHHNEAEWGSEHALRYFKDIAHAETKVSAGFEGYVGADFNMKLPPKNPYSDDDRVLLLVEAEDERLELARSDRFYPFMRGIHGLDRADNGEERYIVKPDAVFLHVYPTPLYGEAVQVINGINRRFSENPMNMWRPKALPARITLDWDSSVSAHEIHITFDTLERAAIDMPYESNHRASGQCVKCFRLKLLRNSDTVFETEQTNHNRFVRISVPDTVVDRLELELIEVWEKGRLPGVFEIRVY